MSEPQKAKSIIVAIAAAVGASVGYAVVTHFMPSNGNASVDETLVQTSSELNKMLPMQLDAETRWDTTSPAPEKSLIYKYTLVNRTKGELDAAAMAAAVRPRMTNNYRTSEQMKAMREAGVTLRYQYYDKNGVYVTEIVVHAND